MFVIRLFLVLAPLAFLLANANANGYDRAPRLKQAILSPRDDAPPKPEDLLNSCPGSHIKSPIQRADNCKWFYDRDSGQSHAVVRQVGSSLPNCSGDKSNVSKLVTDTTTFDSTFTLTSTVSVDFPGISAGLSQGLSHTTTKAEGRGFEMTVPPGQHAVFTAKQYYQPQVGHVLLNYGDRVAGHYYWSVSNVNLDLPLGDPATGVESKPCDEAFETPV